MTDVVSPQTVAVAGPPDIGRSLDRVRAATGLDVAVRAVPISPDQGLSTAQAVGVRVLWARGPMPPGWIETALGCLPDLAWVHSDFVGVDSLPLADLAGHDVVVTNGTGNYSRPMAEWVVLAMLTGAKQLLRFARQSDAGIWDPGPQPDELDGAVALFLGLGSVGTMAAPLAASLGVEVRAVTRSGRPVPPPGVARMVPARAWRQELAGADFVVCALPLTPQTAGMIDASALAAMKPTAWLINVARGGLIDQAALIAALDAGRIAGAVLDCFEEEPLPRDHPLWRRPNVLVLPHYTWASPQVVDRQDRLFARQLEAWAQDRPLANQVDLRAGY